MIKQRRICLAVDHGSEDGLTMDRRTLYFFTESVWPAEDGLTTDRRILYFLTESVWQSIVVPCLRTADGLTTDRRILYFFTYLSGRRFFLPAKTGCRILLEPAETGGVE